MINIRDYIETLLEFRANRKTGKYIIDINSIKPGDKLRIKSDLSGYPVEGGMALVGIAHIQKSMMQHLGEIVTIDVVNTRNGTATVKENRYIWPLEIFEEP